jgi:hypothetical protein
MQKVLLPPPRTPFTPRLFGQAALFQQIRECFHSFPHLFFTGQGSSGKSTLLHDIVDLLKAEAPFNIDGILWLSSEKDRGIHTIRDKVTDFCKRIHARPNTIRLILIDDADTLPLISQQALRRPMETYAHLTRFVFASRQACHLIDPLRSRCMHMELEPISPHDAIPLFSKSIGLAETPPALFDFCVRNFTTLHDLKSVVALYKALKDQGTADPLQILASLQPTSSSIIPPLVRAIGRRDRPQMIESLTALFLRGYLFDDVLLSIEKYINVFPSVNPDTRFALLHFTMLGWISIQQGKEHWLDAIDIVDKCLA